jgi:asparagine synthase (glutamine-hydrolysing)
MRQIEHVRAVDLPVDQMLCLDTKFFLADHNLNYTGKLSMSQGVEVRVPLVDVSLVEQAARIAPRHKHRGLSSKWIFKKSMEGSLPAEVIYRPKTGFGAPLRQWLRGPLREQVEATLSPRVIGRRGLFDPEGVRRLTALDESGDAEASYTILSLMCIATWCRIFLDGEAP